MLLGSIMVCLSHKISDTLGSAGSLIPPHEYHAIRNPSDAGIAVSLHVYQRPLLRCHVFVPEDADAPCAGDGGWMRREERLLGTDAGR